MPKRYILAVCKAHGEKPQEFSRNRDLEYLAANDNLYDNSDVFVRELLQNAIDATMLRGKMEHGSVHFDTSCSKSGNNAIG